MSGRLRWGIGLGVLVVLLQACAPGRPGPGAGSGPTPGSGSDSGVDHRPGAGGGNPTAPPSSGGKLVTFQPDPGGLKLVALPGAQLEWVRPIRPGKWEVTAETVGTWSVDLDRQEAAPWDVPYLWYYYALPYTLPDGRVVSLTGNGQQVDDVRIVIQDLRKEQQTEVGTVDSGIVQIAPAGDSMVAYARHSANKDLWVGQLWQYDWTAHTHKQVAAQGWPVGMLADGRAVAHQDERYGTLFTWRPDRLSERTTPLSPAGVTPFWAIISPDGQRLYYFHAEQGRTGLLEMFGVKTAYASPNRSSPAPNPRVTAVAEYDVATGKTTVSRLPMVGLITVPSFDREGRLTFSIRSEPAELLVRVAAGAVVSEMARGEGAWFWLAGWDGQQAVVASDNRLFGILSTGRLAPRPDRYAWGNGLMLVERAAGVQLVHLESGRSYRVPTLTKLTGAERPAALDATGGRLVMQVQAQPNEVYQVVKVEPID